VSITIQAPPIPVNPNLRHVHVQNLPALAEAARQLSVGSSLSIEQVLKAAALETINSIQRICPINKHNRPTVEVTDAAERKRLRCRYAIEMYRQGKADSYLVPIQGHRKEERYLALKIPKKRGLARFVWKKIAAKLLGGYADAGMASGLGDLVVRRTHTHIDITAISTCMYMPILDEQTGMVNRGLASAAKQLTRQLENQSKAWVQKRWARL
jgi:hypothetical protein